MTSTADELRFELACMTERVALLRERLERRQLPAAWCIYCGVPCRGRVCGEHEGLLELDQEACE